MCPPRARFKAELLDICAVRPYRSGCRFNEPTGDVRAAAYRAISGIVRLVLPQKRSCVLKIGLDLPLPISAYSKQKGEGCHHRFEIAQNHRLKLHTRSRSWAG
jgi:hypothetical protein